MIFVQLHIPIEELASKQLDRISETVHSQGIIALVKMKQFRFDEMVDKKQNLLVAVDRINEPGNLGTIIRTANWFGATGILISEDSVAVTNPKVLRASMGAAFHTPILERLELSDTLLKLKKAGYELFVADSDRGVDFSTVDYPERSVLVLGNETDGVDEKIKSLASKVLMIPKRGKGDSLNVAVAAGIILERMSH